MNLDKVCAAESSVAIWPGAEQLDAHQVGGFLHHSRVGLPLAQVSQQLNGGAVARNHHHLTETHRVRCLRIAASKRKGHGTDGY
ncbi:MAG: hypothetical protein ACYDDU_20750 [Dermatophilaceae bacterium]